MFGRKRRERLRRQAESEEAIRQNQVSAVAYWNELFEQADHGDENAQDTILAKIVTDRYQRPIYPKYFPESLKGSRYAAVVRMGIARSQDGRLPRFLTAYESAASEVEMLEALVRLLFFQKDLSKEDKKRLEEKFGISWDDLHQKLVETAEDQYEYLMEMRESPEHFKMLWDLIFRTRTYRWRGDSLHENDLYKLDVRDFAYPDDWNDLLARHYATPAIESFRDVPDWGPGDVRLLAAQAVDSDDLTNAQIALAFCNCHRNYREAVGDVLTAELAKIVNRHRSSIDHQPDEPREDQRTVKP